MKKLLVGFMATMLCFSMTGGIFAASDSKSESKFMDIRSYDAVYKMSEDSDIKLPFIKAFAERAMYDKIIGSSGLSVAAKGIDIQSEMKGIQTIISGETVNITGKLEYANIIANNVTIDGEISKDVVIVAQSVFITDKAKIGGDLLCTAGYIDLKGTVAGNFIASSAETIVSAKVEKDFRVSSTLLEISASTEMKGDIYIETNSALNILDKYPNAVVEKFVEDTNKPVQTKDIKAVVMSGIIAVLSYGILYYIIRKMSKGAMAKYSSKVKAYPTFTILIGFASLFLIPIEMILILVACAFGLGVVLGPLFILYIALVIAVLLLSTFITGVIIFESLSPKLLGNKEGVSNKWLEGLLLIGIFTALYVLTKLPITSGYAVAFVVIVAIGSTVTNMFRKEKVALEVVDK